MHLSCSRVAEKAEDQAQELTMITVELQGGLKFLSFIVTEIDTFWV